MRMTHWVKEEAHSKQQLDYGYKGFIKRNMAMGMTEQLNGSYRGVPNTFLKETQRPWGQFTLNESQTLVAWCESLSKNWYLISWSRVDGTFRRGLRYVTLQDYFCQCGWAVHQQTCAIPRDFYVSLFRSICEVSTFFCYHAVCDTPITRWPSPETLSHCYPSTSCR